MNRRAADGRDSGPAGPDRPAPPGADTPELAARALDLLAVDPPGLGGAVLRIGPGPETDEWLEAFRHALPPDTPWRRLPSNIDDDRLLGGLDLSASLSAGRPLLARGLLAECDGGVLVLPMAERLGRGSAARLASVMDRGAVHLERDGMTGVTPTRFCLLALDEGREPDEGLSPDLADRLAVHLDANDFNDLRSPPRPPSPARLARAHELLDQIRCDHPHLEALCGTAQALGIDSVRPPLFALRAARAAAALDGRETVNDDDLTLAARLVLLPRARQMPATPPENETQDAPPPPEDHQDAEDPGETPPPESKEPTPTELVLEAMKASLPPGLIASLARTAARRDLSAKTARGGPPARALRRGRPMGFMRGDPRRGLRLHVPSTLKAAAPWQRIRRAAIDGPRGDALQVRAEDFRVVRYKARRQTTRVFVVDASGSAAAQRLAETKGAVELLLSESYATRDQVSLIAFRGAGAELLLPPTRALARAKRELAGLPGGGGTPLSAGLHAARNLALDLERKGQHPVIILMTDGRANVCLDGTQGHGPAGEEALVAARLLGSHGWESLLVDTGRRPRPKAKDLADALGARYLPLPQAGPGGLSEAAARLESAS